MISKRMFRFGMIAAALVALAVIVLGWGVLSTYYDLPEPTDEYRVALLEMTAANQPEGTDGWRGFAELMQDVEQTIGGSVYLKSEQAVQRALMPMLTTESFARRMDELLAHDRYVMVFPKDGPMHEMMSPDASSARHLITVSATHLRDAASRGEWETVTQCARWQLGIGRVAGLQMRSAWINVALHGEGATIEAIDDILRDHEVPAATCVELDALLRAHETPSLEDRMEVWFIECQDGLHWSHGSGGRAVPISERALMSVDQFPDGSAASSLDSIRAGRDLIAAVDSLFGRATHAECLEVLERVRSKCSGALTGTYAERYDQWQAELGLSSLRTARFGFVLEHLPWASSMFLRSIVTDERAVHRSATLMMLAIERFEQAEGRWPESLDDLVPTYVDVLPDDVTWGATTGAGFGYRVCADEEWHGRPYLLYVLGADGGDQGGEPWGSLKTRLWPRSDKNFDARTGVFDVPFGVSESVLGPHMEALWEQRVQAEMDAARGAGK